jgi:hypothetical protein
MKIDSLTSNDLPQANVWRLRNKPFFFLSYIFLVSWGVASFYVPEMNALWLGISALLLATPVMLALWHQNTIGQLLMLHQFQAGRLLHWFGSRRAMGTILRALIAIGLSATALLQSVFFGWLEWFLLAGAPVLFLGLTELLAKRCRPQFTAEVYAQRWVLRITCIIVIVLLFLVWLLVRFQTGEAPAVPMGELVHKAQLQWTEAPSGIVRWALDAGAWGEALVQALGRSSGEPWWRLVLVALLAPVSVLSFAALSFSGLLLCRTDFRRIFGEGLAADEAPPVGALRVAVWSAVATICVMVFFSFVGVADSHVDPKVSPFAVKLLPQCERIGGVAYKVGTIDALQANMAKITGEVSAVQVATCKKIDQLEAVAAQGIERYLDWYFSLGAEMGRLVKMLTGDIDNFLKEKFVEYVFTNTGVEPILMDVQSDHEKQLKTVVNGHSHLLEFMAKNRLVFSEGQCKVVAETRVEPASAAIANHKGRLASGAVAGLIGGGFAAKAGAKAMGKTSMKAAAKVLAKVVGKKAVGAAGGAAVGAVIGSVIPGFGTAIGGVIGGVVGGLAIGAAVDMAVLAVEEKLTRADMKNDLMSAVKESLQPTKAMFACR